MEVGDEFTYTTEITPSNSSYQSITWSSSNSTIVSITQGGKIRAENPGTVTITAVLTNGLSRDITVTRTVKVLKPISGFNVTGSSHELYIGDPAYETKQLSTVYAPSDYEVDGTLAWTSSNTDVVTVVGYEDENTGEKYAIITAVAEGNATVSARVTHYGNTFISTVNVSVKVLTLSFNITNQSANEEIDVEVGQDFQYTTEILPGTSSYKTINWSSSVPTVATVDANGKVRGFAPGRTVITATVPNGLGRDITITRNIRVPIPVQNFDIVEPSFDLYVGDASTDHATITTQYTPSNYEVDGTLEWISSDTDVATVTGYVDENTGEKYAIVTGVAHGDVTISARITHYGNTFIDITTVHVKVLTLSFNITNHTANTVKDVELEHTFQYETEILPDPSSYRTIVWDTSNHRIATIDQDGLLTPHASGTVTVTAYLANGLGRDITLTREVRVPVPITSYDILETNADLYVNDPVEDHVLLTNTFTPSNYQVDDSIAWSSSDTDVATVEVYTDPNTNIKYGKVTGRDEGTATITGKVAHYTDDRFVDTMTVNVKVLATSYDIKNQEAGDTPMEIEVGDEFQYETEILPSNSSYRTVSWSSSDDTKVSVTQTGKITALAPGTVTITTVLQNGLNRTITATRKVKVLIPITGFTINEQSITLYGSDPLIDHATIHTTYLPSNYEVDGTLEWTSSDTDVATVVGYEDPNTHAKYAVVTAANEGDITVTARVTHYGQQFTSSVPVHVEILASSYDIKNQGSQDLKRLEIGDEFQYVTEILPSNSSYKTASWSSSDGTKVSVTQTGKITALAPGTVTITTVLANGLGRDITVTRDVKVLIPITGLDISEQSIDLYIGDNAENNKQITTVYTPLDAEVNRTITWSIDDPTVVSVADTQTDNNGIVTGLKEGTTTVTATVRDYPQFHDSVTVNVKVLALDFDIKNQNENSIKYIEVGEEFTYETEITPEASSYKTITWTSSTPGVATVDSTGKVIGVAYGDTTITAVLTNGLGRDITVTRDIHVRKPITAFDVTEASYVLYITDSTYDHYTLTPVVTPADNEVDDSITWTSSDDNIVEVVDGVITAQAKGTATITATITNYPTFTDTVAVEVKVLAESISTPGHTDATEYMEVGDTFTYNAVVSPENANYQTVTWTSSTPGVATVDPDTGQVNAVAYGDTTITGTLANGLGRTITITRGIHVRKPVTAFSVSIADPVIYVEDSTYDHTTITPTITPSDNEVDDSITWESDDTDIATVQGFTDQQTGAQHAVVTGVSRGTVTITATISHYGQQFVQTVQVEVKVLAESISTPGHTDATEYMEVGDTFTYNPVVSPENSNYQTVTWTSSAPSVATVDPDTGQVNAVAYGDTTITGTLANGLGRTITITRDIHVRKPVTAFSISIADSVLYVGDSTKDHTTITPTITPSDNEVDDSITWESDDTDIATVEGFTDQQTGVQHAVVTGVSGGTVTITATISHYGQQFVQTVQVEVRVLTQSFTITNQDALDTLYLEEEEEFTYTIDIQPENSTYTSVTWTSSVQGVARVDEHGKVTAVAYGDTIITAELQNGLNNTITVTRNVHVRKPISTFGINEAGPIVLYVGDSNYDNATLHTTFTPNDYEVTGTIIWSSSDTDVMTVEGYVDENTGEKYAIVTGVSNGTETITATINQYHKQYVDTVQVEVRVLAQSFNITNQDSDVTMNMLPGDEYAYEVEIVPENSTYTSISWASDDPSVTVDQYGNLTAVTPGDATITATLQNGLSQQLSITRNVKVLVPIESFSINEQSLNLKKNVQAEKTGVLHPTILPNGYEETDDITWESSAEGVATVVGYRDENTDEQYAIVTAVGGGQTTITATLPNGMSDTVTVDVAVILEEFVLETPASIDVEIGRTYETRTSYLPSDTTESTTVTWVSDAPNIATVDEDGVITGVRVGEAHITGTMGSKQVNVTVNVVILISSFTLDVEQQALQMAKNEEVTLTPTITPSNTTESKAITWESDNNQVASVDEYGKVTAHKPGEATITGTLENGMHVDCIVTVITAIDSFTISPATATLDLSDDNNKTITLTTTILPADAEEDKTITWESDDTSVATVDNGVVTAVGNGTTTITGTLPNDMQASMTVTVITPISSFTVDNGTYHELTIGQTHIIESTIDPDGTSESKVIAWESSNTAAATVDGGVVTAVNYGTTTITGTLENNMSIEVTIKVIKPIDNIYLSQSSLSLKYGVSGQNQATLTVYIYPEDTDESKEVTWASTNSNVVSVTPSQDGNSATITAVDKGNATISATLPNGMSAECIVAVSKPITSFTLNNETPITLQKKQTVTLATTILPADTSETKTISWSSNATQVATVNSSGKVTAVKGGTAVITGRLQNNMTVTATINVVVPVTKVSIGAPNIEILPDEVKTLKVTITPSDTTEDKTVTWATSNSSVVTVDNGTITGHNLGTATITATLPSGKSGTTTVTVTLTPSTRMRGDIDDDGDVDINDVILGLKKIFKYVETLDSDYAAADIDNNGRIEVNDMVQILKYIFKYIDVL